ncbi:hypothetical protein BVC71_03110 [Marivivens niveibacter]|uniref:FAD:protein FMN transferase n=1 Tax=Marivivens niveibacter TaxID=1930667 RepID=A0A251X1L9_9RHOB|nr:FAD:protein FMN transferase [Marivivens niveibacter]OUD10502.1 hypothetical protein BVC71_03110 [Marivivens niveibacter]
MILSRRRFITIAAASMLPRTAQAHEWTGYAFGADTSIRLDAPDETADAALRAAIAEIRKLEAQFNLFDSTSAIRELNRSKALNAPDKMFVDLMDHADRAYRDTGGLFDPTIGAMWRDMASGGPVSLQSMGWDQVRFNPSRISIGDTQSITLNGIAQGYATDRITDLLKKFGLQDVLVNIGEYRALGGPFQLGLSDPRHGVIGRRQLSGAAIATSSPAALFVGAQTHIMHPARTAKWSTISVEADAATIADAFSTALCLANLDEINAAAQHPAIRRIVIVDKHGDLSTI